MSAVKVAVINAGLILAILLTILQITCCLIGLLTCNWFDGRDINVGIASGCPTRVISYSNQTVTYCTSFSFDHLKDNTEMLMAVDLVCCSLLGFLACFNLMFAFCKRLGGLNFWILMLDFFMVSSAIVLFAYHNDWEAPEGTHIGITYFIVMIGAVVALVCAFLSSWINKSQIYEYVRLP